MNKMMLWVFIGGMIFGSIIGIIGTHGYMISENYMKVYNTDSGSFVFHGTKIYDLNELKVQDWSKMK